MALDYAFRLPSYGSISYYIKRTSSILLREILSVRGGEMGGAGSVNVSPQWSAVVLR
jgi:hypothetical protein